MGSFFFARWVLMKNSMAENTNKARTPPIIIPIMEPWGKAFFVGGPWSEPPESIVGGLVSEAVVVVVVVVVLVVLVVLVVAVVVVVVVEDMGSVGVKNRKGSSGGPGPASCQTKPSVGSGAEPE